MPDVQSTLQHHYKDASRLDARIQLHTEYSTNKHGLHAWVFDHLRLPPTCQVLEVGCGSGHLWRVNRHRIPAGWDITLADLSAGMLKAAQQQLSACYHSFLFVVHDAQTLPFPERCFDAVIANHMLYHVPNRAAAYAEFRRVLKPSGRLYASTLSRDNMRELDALVQPFQHPDARRDVAFRPLSDRRLRHGFNLENGAAEIAPWFACVTLHRYEDALVVPEAEPLVAYVRSTEHLTEDELSRFQRHIEAVMARHGPIHISKDMGMFEASHPDAD